MSVIQTNARGTDIVELEFYTKGSHQAQVTTRDNVVASDKDYVFGVSELIIPSSSLPLFRPGTVAELFRIKMRVVGAGATTYVDIENNGDTAFNSTFSITDTKKIFTILSGQPALRFKSMQQELLVELKVAARISLPERPFAGF